MVNIKLGENIFENVDTVKLNTTENEEVVFVLETEPLNNTYVVGTPRTCTLVASGWNGTRYTFIASGSVGSNGLQIGLPSESTAGNTQEVVKSALTLTNIESDTSSVTITVSAVTAPTKDITIAIFGLEG